MTKFFYHKNCAVNSFKHISLITIYFYFSEINDQEAVGDFWVKEYTCFQNKYFLNNVQQSTIPPGLYEMSQGPAYLPAQVVPIF